MRSPSTPWLMPIKWRKTFTCSPRRSRQGAFQCRRLHQTSARPAADGMTMRKPASDRRARLLRPLALAGGMLLLIGCVLVYTLAPRTSPVPGADANERERRLVAAIVADASDVWRTQFTTMGKSYVPPELVLFTGQRE